MSCSRSSRRSCCFISIFCRDGREEQPSEPNDHTRQEASVLPALALPTQFGRDSAFSQRDAIAELKAHAWLAEVETLLFQQPRRGTMCAGLPNWLGTLIWVPWMGAAPWVTFCSPVTGVWLEPSPGDPGGGHREAHLPLWQHRFEAHHP